MFFFFFFFASASSCLLPSWIISWWLTAVERICYWFCYWFFKLKMVIATKVNLHEVSSARWWWWRIPEKKWLKVVMVDSADCKAVVVKEISRYDKSEKNKYYNKEHVLSNTRLPLTKFFLEGICLTKHIITQWKYNAQWVRSSLVVVLRMINYHY